MYILCPICDAKSPLVWNKVSYSHEYYCFCCGCTQARMLQILAEKNQRAFLLSE